MFQDWLSCTYPGRETTLDLDCRHGRNDVCRHRQSACSQPAEQGVRLVQQIHVRADADQTVVGHHVVAEHLGCRGTHEHLDDPVRVSAAGLRGLLLDGRRGVDFREEVDDDTGRSRHRCSGTRDCCLGSGHEGSHGLTARRTGDAELANDGVDQLRTLGAESVCCRGGTLNDGTGSCGRDGHRGSLDRRSDVEQVLLEADLSRCEVGDGLERHRPVGRVGDEALPAGLHTSDQLLKKIQQLVGVGGASDRLQRANATFESDPRLAGVVQEVHDACDVSRREAVEEVLTNLLRLGRRRRSDGCHRGGSRRTGTQYQRRGSRRTGTQRERVDGVVVKEGGEDAAVHQRFEPLGESEGLVAVIVAGRVEEALELLESAVVGLVRLGLGLGVVTAGATLGECHDARPFGTLVTCTNVICCRAPALFE